MTKVAHVSASEDGETLMILEAPPNISIASVPVVPARPKPIGRQYTKEDLQVSSLNTQGFNVGSYEFSLMEQALS